MVQGNPHLDDPLESEAVVLIDEVELHLHPGWQQRILGDLQRTFPNAQFIVSTHSPQVLTTVEPQCIVELAREGDRIVAGAPAGATYGAEAGDVLSVVMGVKERPENNSQKHWNNTGVWSARARVNPKKPWRSGASSKSSHPVITPLIGPTSKSGDARCSSGWPNRNEEDPQIKQALSRTCRIPRCCRQQRELARDSATTMLAHPTANSLKN